MQGTPNRAPKAVLWIVLVVLVAGVIGLSYYVYQQDNGNSNTTTVENANVATNGNENSAGYLNSNSTANQNTNNQVSNTNGPANSNVSSPSNSNTASNINNAVSANDKKAYLNEEFGISIKYPSDFDVWETAISDEVRSQYGDGHLFAIGFQPQNLQGAVLSLNVFSKSMEDVLLAQPELYGTKTTKTRNIDDELDAIELENYVITYAVQGSKYTFILKHMNERNAADLTAYYDMVDSLQLTD